MLTVVLIHCFPNILIILPSWLELPLQGDAKKKINNFKLSLKLSPSLPKAARYDSSNFFPLAHWAMSCQMVALNYQTGDRAMQVKLSNTFIQIQIFIETL